MKKTIKFAATGAVSAIAIASLAACSETADSVEGVAANHGDDPALAINCKDGETETAYGVSNNAGDPPQCTQGDFNPEYYAVVYMKFAENSGAPLLTARHSYFPVAEGKEDDLTCAVDFLRSNGSSPETCNVFTDPAYPTVREDFKDFDFGSEQRVYVYVDNKDISFNRVTPMLFTQWGAFDDQYAKPKPKQKDKNKSFGGAAVKTVEGLEVLYFENYYRDNNGKPMGKKPPKEKWTNYSINFNLVACKKLGCDVTDQSAVLPIIVDPDTNNGRGRP